MYANSGLSFDLDVTKDDACRLIQDGAGSVRRRWRDCGGGWHQSWDRSIYLGREARGRPGKHEGEHYESFSHLYEGQSRAAQVGCVPLAKHLGGKVFTKHGHLSRNFSDIPGNELIKEQDRSADSLSGKACSI